MNQKKWLFVIPVLMLGLIAIGIAIGMVLPRDLIVARDSVVETGSPSKVPLVGVRIEDVTLAREMFELAGQKAVVLNYTGGDVRFWVESESNGKKDVYRCPELSNDPASSETNGLVKGQFVWARSASDTKGMENWSLGQRRQMMTTKASGTHRLSGDTDLTLSLSNDFTKTLASSSSLSYRLWEPQESTPSGSRSSSIHISNPIPPGREICLMEFEERFDFNPLASAKTGDSDRKETTSTPPGIDSKLAATDSKKSEKKHTFRVMCKVVAN